MGECPQPRLQAPKKKKIKEGEMRLIIKPVHQKVDVKKNTKTKTTIWFAEWMNSDFFFFFFFYSCTSAQARWRAAARTLFLVSGNYAA